MLLPIAIRVMDASHVGEARRVAARIAEKAGLDETAAGKVSIIVTELATNLYRYATGGMLHVQIVAMPWGNAVDVCSVDSGPGMINAQRCLTDGYSTGGTAGNGLGAVKRLSSEFDVYSARPNGTVVLSRVYASAAANRREPLAVCWGAASVAAPGEEVCGDAWRVAFRGEGAAMMVADGLGHGPLAGEAAEAVAKVFEEHPFQGPARFLETAHAEVSGTRGAAVAIAELEFSSRKLRYAGAGNISGTLLSAAQSRGLVSHNGTLGVTLGRAQQFDYEWPDNGLLVMHSDGIQTRWTLESYPGLLSSHPGIIAAVLLRDFKRGRDDATVVALKYGGNS
jgi:anti-sigma regulatory factor (Ser/Thr protein kinase)